MLINIETVLIIKSLTYDEFVEGQNQLKLVTFRRKFDYVIIG